MIAYVALHYCNSFVFDWEIKFWIHLQFNNLLSLKELWRKRDRNRWKSQKRLESEMLILKLDRRFPCGFLSQRAIHLRQAFPNPIRKRLSSQYYSFLRNCVAISRKQGYYSCSSTDGLPLFSFLFAGWRIRLDFHLSSDCAKSAHRIVNFCFSFEQKNEKKSVWRQDQERSREHFILFSVQPNDFQCTGWNPSASDTAAGYFNRVTKLSQTADKQKRVRFFSIFPLRLRITLHPMGNKTTGRCLNIFRGNLTIFSKSSFIFLTKNIFFGGKKASKLNERHCFIIIFCETFFFFLKNWTLRSTKLIVLFD